jgi:hypothetical protein
VQGGAIENNQAEGRTAGGELLEGFGGGIANSGSSASASPRPLPSTEWIGQSISRRYIPKKFTGGAAYVQDVRLPNMVFGSTGSRGASSSPRAGP